MARRMLKKYPGVGRWSDTDDLLQESLLRLHRALATVSPETPRKFYGLAAIQIRRELIDLARRFFGPEGLATQERQLDDQIRQAEMSEPATLETWSRFHECVEDLPDAERELFSLIWYDGLSKTDAARVLGISLSTVKRLWQSARMSLQDQIDGGELD